MRALQRSLRSIQVLTILMVGIVFFALFVLEQPRTSPKSIDLSKYIFPEVANQGFVIEDGIESTTGLVAQGDWLLVKQNCTSCHSAKLVTQNRADEQGWESTLDWMRQTQGLWDLGTNKQRIIHYLATYYGQEEVARRKPLEVTEWYDIP